LCLIFRAESNKNARAMKFVRGWALPYNAALPVQLA